MVPRIQILQFILDIIYVNFKFLLWIKKKKTVRFQSKINKYNKYNKYTKAPTITGCDPDNGPQSGDQIVTITGSNFGDNATELISVSLAHIPCKEFTHITSNKIQCLSGSSEAAVIILRIFIHSHTFLIFNSY